MKNFILKILGSVLKSIIVFAILFVLAISLYTGKFPPDIKMAKDLITQLSTVKQRYISLLNKSENYLNKENFDANIQQPAGSIGNPSSSSANLENINLQIKAVRSQLNRIEEQNKLILNSFKR